MKLKDDFEKWIVCRVCLKQPKTGLQVIFHSNDEIDLTEIILDCGGVPIVKFDHYPDKICASCLANLKVAHNFRTTCQRSYQRLCKLIPPVYVEPTAKLEESEELQEQLDEVKTELYEVNADVLEDYDNEDQGEYSYIKSSNHSEDAANNLDNKTCADSSDEEYVPEHNNRVSPRKNVTKCKTIKMKSLGSNKVDVEEKEFVKVARQSLPSNEQTKTELVCDICGAIYLSQRRLKGHIKLHTNPKPPKAPKEKSFICEICGNIYTSKKPLNEHIKLHTGIKPHECEICGYAFVQLYQLTRHMNKHTGNRPYKCNYCPKAFGDRSSKVKHHRTHTNERPFGCDVCGKTFPYANSLKIHKMIHTGEKPFACDICGKAFPQSCKLRNHLRTHAKKNKLEPEDKNLVETIKAENN